MKKSRTYWLVILLPLLIYSKGVPFPEPGHEGLNVKSLGTFDEFEVGLWLQYRIMYNNSNIPGPGGTTYDNSANYDFFRQRFRIGVNVQKANKVGVYTQLEYRGGWGGSSPALSDARDSAPVNNPYNRLQPRGIRYGFIYYAPSEKLNLSAGIIPLTDGVGRILFDADWDFNVGGIVLGGKLTKGDYRLGYVRLIEGVGGTRNQIGKDAEFMLADYYVPLGKSVTIGAHIYHLTGPGTLNVMRFEAETWYGFTTQGNFGRADLSGVILLNRGSTGEDSHNGVALKLDGGLPLGKTRVNVQAITATGDEAGKTERRFVTPHQILGTGGYWGYTHIFVANGPSDVNDLGVEIGNGGAGLSTLQVKIDTPITDKLKTQLFGGWFQSDKKRNQSKFMGTEFGGMLSYRIEKYLTWQVGIAYAKMGAFFGENVEDLNEIYSRFQFTW